MSTLSSVSGPVETVVARGPVIKRRRLWQLEALRGVAAFYVVLHHTTSNYLTINSTIWSFPFRFVGIYAIGDPSGESMAGLAVLVYDHGQAVICNIVGHVSIGKLMKLASNKNMSDLLQTLQGGGKESHEKSKEKIGKPDASASTNQPVEAPKPAPKDSGTK